MPLTVSTTRKSDFEIAPEGPTIGICYRVIDLGTQQVEYQGEKKLVPQVCLFFEMPNELTKDGRPKIISNTYTLSLGEKAKLRPVVRDLTQEQVPNHIDGFDISCLIGKAGVVDIIHKEGRDGKIRSYIQSVSKVRKGTTVPALHNEPLVFDLGKFDSDTFAKLPEYYQGLVKQSKEYQDMFPPSDIPF